MRLLYLRLWLVAVMTMVMVVVVMIVVAINVYLLLVHAYLLVIAFVAWLVNAFVRLTIRLHLNVDVLDRLHRHWYLGRGPYNTFRAMVSQPLATPILNIVSNALFAFVFISTSLFVPGHTISTVSLHLNAVALCEKLSLDPQLRRRRVRSPRRAQVHQVARDEQRAQVGRDEGLPGRVHLLGGRLDQPHLRRLKASCHFLRSTVLEEPRELAPRALPQLRLLRRPGDAPARPCLLDEEPEGRRGVEVPEACAALDAGDADDVAGDEDALLVARAGWALAHRLLGLERGEAKLDYDGTRGERLFGEHLACTDGLL